jgi:hypothetical protein
MFGRVDIPNADPARTIFGVHPKWIALLVAFDVLLVAVVLWVAFGRQPVDDHLVTLDNYELRLGADVICPVMINPHDQMPDFPDSVWSEFEIEPLRTRLRAREDVQTGVFRLGAIPSMPFWTLETVLRTMRSAGVARLELVDSQSTVPITLRDASPTCSMAGMAVDCTPVESLGKVSPFWCFLERSDTLWFLALGQERSLARSISMPRGDVDPGAVASVRDSLRRWFATISRGDTLDSVGIFLSPRDSFGKVLEITKFVREASGKEPWLGKKPHRMDRFLSDILRSAITDEPSRTDSTQHDH